MFPIIYLIFQMKTEYRYRVNTSISTKFCSLQQYLNNLFFYFTKEKDLLRIKKTNRMETKSSFYS